MNKSNTASLVLDCKNNLGEGPVWDHKKRELLWVDFGSGVVCRLRPEAHQYTQLSVTDNIMVVIPTNCDNWIWAAGNRIVISNPGTHQIINQVTMYENKPGNRFNDGKCDAMGRLWIGTMSDQSDTPTGAIYKIHHDLSYEKMDGPYIIPNGIAWNANNTEMYVVDSMMKTVFRYYFNLENGTVHNKAPMIDTSAEKGLPDGMTIDADDNLWIAFWQGQSVVQYNSKTGKVMKRIFVPAFIPCSCCFGGDRLDTLYITSSRKYDTDDNIAEFPESGGLFSYHPGVKGVPMDYFNEL